MSDYDLTHISERDFEHLVQALALRVIGPGANIYGVGPDGAREVTFEGPMLYPSPASGWNGYLVLQVKHCLRPSGDTKKDGQWAIDQLASELSKFNDPKRKLRGPEYYILVTNVVLTPVSEKGSHDKAMELLRVEGEKFGLKGFDIWHFDKLCRLLDGNPEVCTAFTHLITPGHVLASIATQVGDIHAMMMRPPGQENRDDSAICSDSENDAKPEIDRAGRYLEQGKLEVALELLDEVEREFGDRLSPRGWYRVLANKGNIARAKGEWKVAANFCFQAKQFQPTDKEARLLEVMGHYMLQQNDTALKLVKKLREEFPDLTRACSLELSLAPKETPFSVLVAGVPAEHANDAEVLMALANRAGVEGRFDLVEEYARRAHAAAPKWPEPMLLLAETILETELGSAEWTEPDGPVRGREVRFREAIKLFDEGLSAQQPVVPERAVLAELNRATAYDALGDTDRALADLERFYKQHDDLPDAVFRYASALAAKGRIIEASAILKPSLSSTNTRALPAILLYVQIRADEGTSEGRAEALAVLQKHEGAWKHHPLSFRASWVQTIVRLLLADNQVDRARNVLSDLPPGTLSPEIRLALEARLAQVAGDDAKARSLAEEAERQVTADSLPDDVRRLAQTLEVLGKPEVALRLWKRIAPRNRFSQATRQMLECAARIGDDDLIIDTCATLRDKGVVEPKCVDLELAALARRSPRLAANLIESLLERQVDDTLKQLLRLRLSHIGIYTKQPKWVESDPAKLPLVSDVNVHMGRAVVNVLIRSNGDAAARYAYELYRRFPDEFESHMAVIESYGLTLERRPHCKQRTVVEPGCAVCIQREGTKKREWWIIEDGPHPSLSRNERSASDPAVQQMLGKKKGERFNLRTEPVAVEARIIAIEDKIVYRMRDCFSGMETRFANETPIWSFNVKKGRKWDFSAFLQQLDLGAKEGEERDEWYRQNAVPLTFFAKKAHVSLIEAVQHIAGSKSLSIRCCNGSEDEIRGAMAALESCTRLLIDSSALATIFITDTLSVLEQVPAECVVTEHTMYEFSRMEILDHPEGKEIVKVAKVGNQYVQITRTPAELKQFRERVRTFIAQIEKCCTVLPGGSLARIPSDHRESLMDICGRGALESMVAAAERDSVLWTDDLVLSGFSYELLKTRRVWTQAVVQWLGSAQLVSEQAEDHLSVDLQAAGYFWTRLSPRAILGAGRASDWDISNPKFAAALDYFSAPEADIKPLEDVAAGFLRLVWQGGLPVGKPEVVTFQILTSLDNRPGGLGVISRLVRNRQMWFGNDLFNAARFKECALLWFQHNRRIITPSDFL